jgi:serine/threonine-protein kinase
MVSPESMIERLNEALSDRYRIERELGRGGMATVYLAEDLKHNRKVAVKVLDPQFAAAVGPDRFLREIQIAARLTHPHILTVHDSGEADSHLFYVMPFVEGESLRARLNRVGPLPVEDALQTSCEVAEALIYAHERGILHRDIKPENILLSAGGAMVADFGIARSVDSAWDEKLTATGSTLGTPVYMSPEQAAGEEELDGRSDLYALACVLHEMLTGDPPFSGLSARAMLVQKMTAEVPPFRKLREEVPEELEAVVLKALAREPTDRFPQVLGFEQALRSGAPPTDWMPPRTKKKWRRRVAASAGVVVAGLAGWWALGNFDSPPAHERVIVLAPELTGDSLRDAYVEALHGDLIRSMGSVSGLDPLSRPTAVAMRERDLSFSDIAAEVDAESLVVLAARWSNDSLLADVELWTAGEELVWTSGFGEPFEASRQLPARMALALAQEVGSNPTGEETTRLTRVRPVVPVAWEAFVLGRSELEKPPTPSSLERSIEYFLRATTLDSMFAEPYAALAVAHNLQGVYYLRPGTAAFADARRYATQALALDSMLAEAHAALAQARLRLDWDWDGAEQSFLRALELNPNLADAHWDYGYMLYHLHRWNEALTEMRMAVRLAPLNQEYQLELGAVLSESGAFDEGLQVLDSARSKYPDSPYAPIYSAYAYAPQGRWAEAAAEYDRAIANFEASGEQIRPVLLALAGQAYAKAGYRDRAEGILGRLEEQLTSQEAAEFVPPDYLGVLYISLGEPDLGMGWVQRAYDQREQGLLFLGSWMYTGVESHPIYQDILGKVFGDRLEHPPPS